MGRSTDRRRKRDERAEPERHGMHSLEFRLPDLGEGLTEAEIVHWLVDVGDLVAVDQPVVEVETAKAMVEVPCPYGGVVTARFGEEGAELPVGAPLLTVAAGQPRGAADSTRGSGDQHAGRGRSGGPGTGAGSGPGTSAAQAGDEAYHEKHHEEYQGEHHEEYHGEYAESAEHAGHVERAPENGPGAGARGTVADRPAAGRRGGRTAAADEGSGHVLVGYGTAGAQARRRRARPASGGHSWDAHGPHGGTELRGLHRDAALHGPHGAAELSGSRRGAEPRGSQGGAGLPGDDAAEADGASATGPVPVISPLVRKIARDHGLDLRELSGSGPDGLILRADVERAVRAAASVQAPPATSTQAAAATQLPDATARGSVSAERAGSVSGARAAAGAGAGSGLRIPLRGMRGAIADKMARSRREIPDATCWVDADATELLSARATMNAAGGPKISVLALLARICTAALARYPELNATVDIEAREIVRLDRVHLGFAAQTDRGLLVPVVRDAHTQDAQSLSTAFARLTEAARAGTVTPGDLTGSTFTLNNYGVFGVDGSTPIVNHPEAAMLGVGRISAKPWVHQGELAVRQVVQLSLTFDHRVCDGGTAGGFLRHVADCVEQPVVLLRSL